MALFSEITIRPTLEGGWKVYVGDLPLERKDENHFPNAVGFYHYPGDLGKDEAFRRLKACMIRSHQKEIEDLTKSLEALKNLELPEV
jgi:hypothetical protein